MANFNVTVVNGVTQVVAESLTVAASAAAAASATLSQAWAEGTLPGGPGTKSAREHSQDADNSANVASQARDVAIAAGVQYPSEAAAVAALADGAFGSYLDASGNPVWGQRTGATMTPLPGPWIGSERVGFRQSGADAVTRTVQDKLRDIVSIKDFGAKAGASNAVNTAAVQAAAATGKPFTLDGLTVNLTSGVVVTNNVFGPGRLVSSTSILTVGADNVLVDSVEFEGTATGGTSVPIAVAALGRSGVTVRNCYLKNCRATVRNQALSRQTDFRFQNNKVDADFSLVEHIENQNDVVTVRGIDGVWITDNNFTVLNVHRVFKIADTEAATTSGTDFRARNVFVTNNRIVGSTDSGRQVMDLFFFTSDIIVAQNLIDVSGFGVVVENKTGMAQNYNQNTFITGNKISNDFAGIALQGSYGATTAGYDVGYQNALISGNVVISTAPIIENTRHPIEVRFYDNVQITGNNVVTPLVFAETAGLPCIRVSSNAYATVNNNTATNGTILFTRSTTNASAEPFSSTILSIVCCGNTINNFGGTGFVGGIQIDNIGTASSLRVVIEGNYVKQDIDDGASAGCIAINNSTVNTVSVCNNIGVMANAAEQRLRILSSTITQVIESNNSWNQVGRASATYDPPLIAAGTAVTTTLSVAGAIFATDVVERVQFSRALAGLVMTAWVSATNTVTVQFYNPTSGGIDLQSGTLQVVVERFTVV